MIFLRTLIVGLTFPILTILWAIYFFVCLSVGSLLAFIPIGIMKISGMPEIQLTHIGNELFVIFGMFGLIFCIYTTYRFLCAVRKSKGKPPF